MTPLGTDAAPPVPPVTSRDSAGGAGGEDKPENIWTSYSTRERVLLTAGSVAAYVIFSLIGRAFDIPAVPDYQAALIVQPSAMLTVAVAGVTLVACVLLATMIAGRLHFESGLFCACIGMAALSIRGGPVRYVLMYATSDRVFIQLAFELVLLFGVVAAGWYVLLILRDNDLLKAEPLRDDDPHALPAQGFMAMGAQVVAMILAMQLLAQNDRKAQVLWALGLSSFAGALFAHNLFPARPSIWFWTAPFVVGVLGYVAAWFGPGPLIGGDVGGYLPALARPLPLDYATLGTAGALFGYWTSRKWQHEREHDPDNPDDVEEALDEVK